jgi:hypothetical protein
MIIPGLQPTGEPDAPYPSLAAMDAEGMRPTGRELDLYNCAADLVNALAGATLDTPAERAFAGLRRALRRYRVPRVS